MRFCFCQFDTSAGHLGRRSLEKTPWSDWPVVDKAVGHCLNYGLTGDGPAHCGRFQP